MRTAVAFALGFAAGMLCLSVALWSTGRLLPTSAQAAPTVVEAIPDKTPSIRANASLPPEPEPSPTPAPAAPEVLPQPEVVVPVAPGAQPSLAMPIAGVDIHKLRSNFSEARGGHSHEALDIMASRGTPVMAVAEGNVVKLFTSKWGGLTVYQFDDSRTWCYYYAHLDRYAAELKEGTLLRKGDVLGYVGSTGDASPNAPHLHFAVFQLGPEKKWWKGTAVDPLTMLK